MPAKNSIVIVDPQTAGISGDMFLAALIDLGANQNKIKNAISEAKKNFTDCRNLKIQIKNTLTHTLKAKQITIRFKEKSRIRTGEELHQALKKSLSTIVISNKAKKYAITTLDTILKSEAKLHSTTNKKIHLHEIASFDTIADIIGVAVALDDLKLLNQTKFFSLPVNVGGGKIKTSHGILTIPTYITLEILKAKNFQFEGNESEGELATPTGISLLTNLAEPIKAIPEMQVTQIGYGAGYRNLKARPNILRIFLGETLRGLFNRDEVYILETNLDDVSGEIIGYLIEKLLQEGAKDTWAVAAVTKKARPSFLLKAMTDRDHIDHLTKIMFAETGTLGIRITKSDRVILQRELKPVKIELGEKKVIINVKFAKDASGKVIQLKPEYEQIKKTAIDTGLPLRKILEETKKRASETIPE
ncbi:MAG: nickel pincer cofactor biosynthesis protein LarC [Candidatus Bathyarchaeota archaeon]